MNVRKANGKIEPFSDEKVISSMHRAGVPKNLEDQALAHIKNKLYEGIPTSVIYQEITQFLGSSKEPYTKGKYSLKQAVMALGPTGYPFEDFIAELFKAHGYKTLTRQILQGKCITHETDVVVEKDGKKQMVEAKFHNNSGIHTQVHVSLYTKARFDDVKEKNNLDAAWLVTNTKITTDALTYAQCVGLNVMSWDYPQGESLRDIIEKHRFYPITSLSNLSTTQAQELLSQHVVLCSDICKNPLVLSTLHLDEAHKQEVLKEAAILSRSIISPDTT